MIHVYCHYPSPIGTIRLRAIDDALVALDHTNQQSNTLDDCWKDDPEHPVLALTRKELDAYFTDGFHDFTVPLNPIGTEFQQKVWNALTKIPYAETCSYADIAIAIDNPKGVRAVGLANGKNPISIFIPCHRVIGKNGSLTGYGGGLDVKKILLDHEQSHVN